MERSISVNKLKNMTIIIKELNEIVSKPSRLVVKCSGISARKVAYCNLSFNGMDSGEKFGNPIINFNASGDFNPIQMNRLEVDIKDPADLEPGSQFTFIISVRLSDAALEVEKRLLKIDVLIDGIPCLDHIQLKIVDDAEYKAVLNAALTTKTLDVYPSDTVRLAMTISHHEKSRLECKLVDIRMHRNLWIKNFTVSASTNSLPVTVTQPYRLTEVSVSGLCFWLSIGSQSS
ncbi:unnamed protein product [Echinostoma caproni]|uniref:Integrin_alpha2 domain-containing protein n=1 Tax=Echinostoma caproni TaxID=27848 RepID=A0A183A1J5_9TREM|nr:unnamed protein product [Echinostoma caproni]